MLSETLKEQAIKALSLSPNPLTIAQRNWFGAVILPYLREEQVVWLSIHATDVSIQALARNQITNGAPVQFVAHRNVVVDIEMATMMWNLFPHLHAQHGHSLARYLKTQ